MRERWPKWTRQSEVRKVYGKDHIRFLRCNHCGQEFSERKNTALWNTKIPEARAIEVGCHLAEGVSLKGTARLTYSYKDTVKRLLDRFGNHAQAFHEQTAQHLDIDVLEWMNVMVMLNIKLSNVGMRWRSTRRVNLGRGINNLT